MPNKAFSQYLWQGVISLPASLLFRRQRVLIVIGSILTVALSYGLLLPPQASAQEQESSGTIEEVLVTARKREESLQNVPIAVTALSGAQLEEAGFTSLEQIDNMAPGLFLPDGSGAGKAATPYIRGVGQRDTRLTLDPGVAIYLDGVYVGRPDGALFKLIDIASVEVLRGPQGTLFGKNSTGGALVINTNRPNSDQMDGRVVVSTGSYGLANVQAVFNVPISNNLSTRWSVTRLERDGFTENIIDGSEWDNVDYQSVYGQVLWQPSDKTDVNISFGFSDQDERSRGVQCQFNIGNDSAGLLGMRWNTDTEANYATNAAARQAAFTRIKETLAAGNSLSTLDPLTLSQGLATQSLLFFESLAFSPSNTDPYINARYEDGTRIHSPKPYDATCMDEQALADDKFGSSIRDSRYTAEVSHAAVTLTHAMADNMELKGIFSWRTLETFQDNDIDGSSNTMIDRDLHEAAAKPRDSDELSLELQLTGDLMGGKMRYAGGIYYYQQGSSNVDTGHVGPFVYGGGLGSSLFIFPQLARALSEVEKQITPLQAIQNPDATIQGTLFGLQATANAYRALLVAKQGFDPVTAAEATGTTLDANDNLLVALADSTKLAAAAAALATRVATLGYTDAQLASIYTYINNASGATGNNALVTDTSDATNFPNQQVGAVGALAGVIGNSALVFLNNNIEDRKSHDTTSYATYGQISYDLNDSMELTLGLRYTYEKRELQGRVVDINLSSFGQSLLNPFNALAGGDAGGYAPFGTTFVYVNATLNNNGTASDPSDDYYELPFTKNEAVTAPTYKDVGYSKDSDDFDQITPMLNIKWTASEDALGDSLDYLMAYATYSQGFKAGGVFLTQTVGITTFKPEIADNFEIGLKLDALDRRLRLNAAMFLMDYKDLQFTVARFNDAGQSLQRQENIADAQITGIELELTWIPLGQLEVLFSAAWLDAEYEKFDDETRIFSAEQSVPIDRSGEPFISTPELTWFIGVQYPLMTPLGRVFLRADANYRDEINFAFDYEGEATKEWLSDDVIVFNLRATLDYSDDIQITLWGSNIGDEVTIDGGTALVSTIGGGNLSYTDPQTWGIDFSFSF